MVQDACNDCCDALIQCCSMEQILDQISPCIINTAPAVKNGTLRLVEKHALISTIEILHKVCDVILILVAKVMDDKDSTVRDNAIHCMGIFKGRLDEKTMSKYLKDLNAYKTEKLEEAAKESRAIEADSPMIANRASKIQVQEEDVDAEDEKEFIPKKKVVRAAKASPKKEVEKKRGSVSSSAGQTNS